MNVGTTQFSLMSKELASISSLIWPWDDPFFPNFGLYPFVTVAL